MDGGHRGLRFPVLPGIDHKQVSVEALLLKALQAHLAVRARHVWVTDHQDPAAGLNSRCQEFVTEAVKATGTDHHLVGVAFQRDGDPTQGW